MGIMQYPSYTESKEAVALYNILQIIGIPSQKQQISFTHFVLLISKSGYGHMIIQIFIIRNLTCSW